MHQSETSATLKIRVLNVSKKDLLNDLEKAAEFDQSALFQKVYEAEYGVFGGEPYGALVGDYEFANGNEDMALLERISNVAAAAHAPFVGARRIPRCSACRATPTSARSATWRRRSTPSST